MQNSGLAKSNSKTLTILIVAAIIIITFLAYQPVLRNNFVSYDDIIYITENPYIINGFSLTSVKWAFTTFYSGNWHPVTWLSHILDCELFGLNPVGHHIVNLAIHIAAAVLLFLILKKMTSRLWISAFVAFLFALHPLNVESVAWAAERKNTLSGFLWMLTIAVYLFYTRKPNLLRYILMVICFALGLMAKPVLVTLPLVLLLLDYWTSTSSVESPLNRTQNNTAGNSYRQIQFLIIEKIPLLIMSVASCAVTYIAQQKSEAVADIMEVPLTLRIENALVSYILYIGKIFYPVRLAVLYPLEINGIALWKPIAAFIILLIITAIVILNYKRRYLPVGWLWYLGVMVPMIGLVQVGVQSMADRYAYLPSIGIFIIIAWAGSEIISKSRFHKTISVSLSIAILIYLTICTYIQATYWKDDISLCRHALSLTKNNYIMHNNYGEALRLTGRIDEAVDNFKQALEINPNHATAHNNLGIALRQKGLLNEAAEQIELALKIKPNYAKAHNNYGVILADMQQYDLAIEHISKALSINPWLSTALFNLCKAAIAGARLDEAINILKTIREKQPDNHEIYYFIAMIYTMQEKYEPAIENLMQALRLKPDYSDACLDLANLYNQTGKTRQAIEQYQKTLELAPDRTDVMCGLAWLLITCPDKQLQNPQLAVKLVEKACILTNHKEPQMLALLAHCYAETGRLDKAIQADEAALKITNETGQQELAEQIKTALMNYKQKTVPEQ